MNQIIINATATDVAIQPVEMSYCTYCGTMYNPAEVTEDIQLCEDCLMNEDIGPAYGYNPKA